MRTPPLAALCLSALLAGCASTYTSPRSKPLSFKGVSTDTTGLSVEYDYSAMREAGNVKYANKAATMGLSLPAIRIKNNTGRDLVIRKDVEFDVGGTPVEPSEPGSETAEIRQMTGAYAWWLTAATINIFTSKTECDGYSCSSNTSFIPVGLIAGPLITAINCGISSGSNTSFEDDVVGHNLLGMTVKAGQTVTGFLVLKDLSGNKPISARLKN